MNLGTTIEKDDFIGFYDHLNGPYRAFSNWHQSDFLKSNGIYYTCVEQYIMSEKAYLFSDRDVFNEIMASRSPKEMQLFGILIASYDNDIWVQNRKRILEEGIFLKFSQNCELKKMLLDTKNKYIANCSHADNIYGIGYNMDEALSCQDKWGQNLLGKALMNIRLKFQ